MKVNLHFVNVPAPASLPIFRTEPQARILAYLLLHPDVEASLTDLAGIAAASWATTMREVDRLLTAGLLRERRVGRTRLIRAATDSPFFEPLVAILSRTHGPLTLVSEVVGRLNLEGTEEVYIVGSWAARNAGQPGPAPRDLDLVVVGEPPGRQVRALNRELEDSLGFPVQITVVDRDVWNSDQDGFVQQVRSRPHLLVLGGQE